MNSRKNHNKKLMLPVLIFLVGCLVLIVVLYHSYRSNYKQVRNVTALNATTYAERLQNDMNRGVAITDTLEEIAISENGKIDNFQKVARDLMILFRAYRLRLAVLSQIYIRRQGMKLER